MQIGGTEISVIEADITEVDVEAIVNAANNKFYMGGGVALAIKKKGGKVIEEEAIKEGPVDLGKAILTTAGSLKAKYVIHAVTMGMDFKTDEEIIRKATENSLLLAQNNKISSIAFCALGCGVGGFPYEACAKIMAQEVFKYLREIKNPTLKRIVFVLYSHQAYQVFLKNVLGYLEYMYKKILTGPYLTVDGIVEYKDGIVMVERSNPPFGWALPGGFVDYGETVQDAAVREIKEETGLDFLDVKQFKVYSDPKRDPRFHTVSVVFVGKGKGKLKAATDAKTVEVFQLNNLPKKIAFDHYNIIKDFIAYSQCCKNKFS
ncbi:MAG: macro domain-containing protein [Candidatus Omnitrophica bacterium]|nr:macro domain-containing protein [Candidatus Omnitrophota bacterium]